MADSLAGAGGIEALTLCDKSGEHVVDRFRTYLFQRHTEDEIRRWAVSLSYFRFCRAYGGHANDGDQFLAAFRYTNENDFVSLLGTIGLSPKELLADNPRPVPGKSYSLEEFDQFKTEINDFPNLEQIGHCEIAGNKCFVWAADHRVTVSVVGGDDNPYEVSEDDFQRAQRIDSQLQELADRVIDPPQDDQNCISPKYYPSYWEHVA